jgi:hypothetical protein
VTARAAARPMRINSVWRIYVSPRVRIVLDAATCCSIGPRCVRFPIFCQ